MSLVRRRSTLCSGSPSSASRGMVSPEAMVDGPWKRDAMAMTSPFASVAVTGIAIAFVGAPAAQIQPVGPGLAVDGGGNAGGEAVARAIEIRNARGESPR